MTRNKEAKKLLAEIIDDVIYTKLSLTAILRKYLRVSQFLELKAEEEWTQKNLNGFILESDLPSYRNINIATRYSWVGILPSFIVNNRNSLQLFYKKNYVDYKIFDSIPKIEHCLSNGIPYTLDFGVENVLGVEVNVLGDVYNSQIEEILQKTKNHLFQKVSRLQIILEFDLFSEEIFNEAKEFVDASLNTISPDALSKITSAYKDLNDADISIKWSQIALACIDGLIDFASSIYKQEYLPKNEVEPIREHFVKKIKFTLKSQIKSKEKLKYIESLGNYIKDLKDYLEANKHRSDLIIKNDARRCVIYTYLIINDVLEEILKEIE